MSINLSSATTDEVLDRLERDQMLVADYLDAQAKKRNAEGDSPVPLSHDMAIMAMVPCLALLTLGSKSKATQKRSLEAMRWVRTGVSAMIESLEKVKISDEREEETIRRAFEGLAEHVAKGTTGVPGTENLLAEINRMLAANKKRAN